MDKNLIALIGLNMFSVLGRLFGGLTTPRANMASKRSHDDVQHIPEGFKIIDEDSDTPKVVYEEYHKFELAKVPLARIWFDTMEDDKDEAKLKMYVKIDDLVAEDIEVIKKVDASLAETAKLLGRKHSPLVDKDGHVKLSTKLKMQRRRKQSLANGGYLVTGKFILSSVYAYNQYYGLNLIVSRKDKRPVFSQVPKPKTEDKTEDKAEDKVDGDDEQ
jgi:hypothetical protein